jgi:hypothetical protein
MSYESIFLKLFREIFKCKFNQKKSTKQNENKLSKKKYLLTFSYLQGH